MYYLLWFVVTMAASLFAVVTGLWIERKISEE